MTDSGKFEKRSEAVLSVEVVVKLGRRRVVVRPDGSSSVAYETDVASETVNSDVIPVAAPGDVGWVLRALVPKALAELDDEFDEIVEELALHEQAWEDG